jgi:dTDP-glucose 4,6-dehydratase
MKFLIYGGNGWIGKQFIHILKEKHLFYITSIGKARLYNIEDIKKEIEEVNPTHIFCFVGRTHGKIGDRIYTTIDYLEEPMKLVDNIRDNLFSPVNIVKLCQNRDIHVTYLGTGCIFKYDDNHLYGVEENGFVEESKPNFFGSSYSIVKGFTDQIMSLYDNVLNLRIRMPITDIPNPRNFITKITTYDKICSIPNSMSVLPELLPIVLELATKKETGTLNLTNPGLISHNEILTMYKEIVDPNFEWKNFTLEEQSKILACDRSNNFLDTTKLQTLFPNVKNIKTSVKDMLKKYKEYDFPKKNKNNLDFKNDNSTVLLITGGCGFIGSNFINLIMQNYDKINLINIDALYYCANEKNVDEKWRKSERYTFVNGNLCSFDFIRYVFKMYNPTHVIHFAAQSHVQNSFTESLKYTQDNIVGTHTLLECVKLYGNIKKFIHVSTDEVYGESLLDINEMHKTEQSILCPTNPYAATKAGAELIAQSYNHSFNIPIVITRGNNVYGPNQYPEKVIPRFINQLKNDEKLTIQGDGSCVRAFLHSYDTATAFQCILEKGKIGEIYNIGCDEGMEYSIMNLAKILIKKIKNTEDYDEWITYIKDRPFNDKRYYISNEKLKNMGWKIKINFEEGVDELIKLMN